MSLDRILETLEEFGLSRIEAEVYVYLSKRGPQAIVDITSATKLSKSQLFTILEKLKKKGFIYISSQGPVMFFALAFEKIIDTMITIKDEEAKSLKKTQEELLLNWRILTRTEKV